MSIYVKFPCIRSILLFARQINLLLLECNRFKKFWNDRTNNNVKYVKNAQNSKLELFMNRSIDTNEKSRSYLSISIFTNLVQRF